MHVPSQLTIAGREERRTAPQPPPEPPRPLFTAPQTIRGQMVLTPSEQHAAARCQTLRRSEEQTAAMVQR